MSSEIFGRRKERVQRIKRSSRNELKEEFSGHAMPWNVIRT